MREIQEHFSQDVSEGQYHFAYYTTGELKLY